MLAAETERLGKRFEPAFDKVSSKTEARIATAIKV